MYIYRSVAAAPQLVVASFGNPLRLRRVLLPQDRSVDYYYYY